MPLMMSGHLMQAVFDLTKLAHLDGNGDFEQQSVYHQADGPDSGRNQHFRQGYMIRPHLT